LPDEPRLDETDIRILKTLLDNSRTSFTSIAKECKITVAAVRKRYKRLWSVGVINGEIVQINPHSLGYDIIADIGISTPIENEKEVIKFLLTLPFIVVIHPNGFAKYNLGVTIALQNIEKLTTVLQRLESNQSVKRVDTLIWVEGINIDHPENLVIKPAKGKYELQSRQKIIATRKGITQLDEKDKQIIKILLHNSRSPFNAIAKEVGISTANVIQRYKKLRENVITLSTITIDLRKLGYKAFIHALVKVKDRSKMPEIYSQFLEIPNLVASFRHFGSYDFRGLVAIKDFEDAFKLKDQIRRIKDIEEIDLYLHPIFPKWPLSVFAYLVDPDLSFENHCACVTQHSNQMNK
jgi:Lrp/AsnC family transcriptional regulator, regulator for asnA, asnC and gidA